MFALPKVVQVANSEQWSGGPTLVYRPPMNQNHMWSLSGLEQVKAPVIKGAVIKKIWHRLIVRARRSDTARLELQLDAAVLPCEHRMCFLFVNRSVKTCAAWPDLLWILVARGSVMHESVTMGSVINASLLHPYWSVGLTHLAGMDNSRLCSYIELHRNVLAKCLPSCYACFSWWSSYNYCTKEVFCFLSFSHVAWWNNSVVVEFCEDATYFEPFSVFFSPGFSRHLGSTEWLMIFLLHIALSVSSPAISPVLFKFWSWSFRCVSIRTSIVAFSSRSPQSVFLLTSLYRL